MAVEARIVPRLSTDSDSQEAGIAVGRPGCLVETATGDGVRLNGFRQPPGPSRSCGWLWIVIPGVAGNFYGSTLLSAIAEAVLDAGHDSLRVNTRGRDQIAFVSRGGFPAIGGSAFETMGEAVDDVRAWCGFAADAGYRHVGLIGHSLGAIKILEYLWSGKPPASTVKRAVLISPPRLSHELLRSDARHGASFARDFDEATAALDRGEGDRLLRIRFPQPLYISAATFVDKYGPHDRHDYMERCSDLPVPTAWIFGELEVRGQRANFADCDTLLRERLNPPAGDLVVLPEGDHNYTAARPRLREELQRIILAAARSEE